MMGHSDIKTTTIYLAASAAHLRGAIAKHPLNGVERPVGRHGYAGLGRAKDHWIYKDVQLDN
jgi:hypothetical protein